MHSLDLAARKGSLDGEVESGKGKGGSNRGRRWTNMLGAIGVNHVLMDERRIPMGKRVIRQLIHQGTTFAGGVSLAVTFEAQARPLQAATRAQAHQGE